MLRIDWMQRCFNLPAPGAEDALYDSAGMRQFLGIDLDLGREPVPHEAARPPPGRNQAKVSLWGEPDHGLPPNSAFRLVAENTCSEVP